MTPLPIAADVVVLAGDIDVGRRGIKWAKYHFPTTPVIYVMGNHEYYRHSFPELMETLRRETEGTNIHLLEDRAVEISGYRFLGCTLWSDFMLGYDPEGDMRVAEALMNDYRIITNSKESRPLLARDTVMVHKASVSWLDAQFRGKSDLSRTIVVTHHAPSQRSEASYHADSPLKGAFTSNLDSLVERSGVPIWIHGHTHYNVDYKIGVTRVLSNQRGYPQEPCKGFDPALVIEI